MKDDANGRPSRESTARYSRESTARHSRITGSTRPVPKPGATPAPNANQGAIAMQAGRWTRIRIGVVGLLFAVLGFFVVKRAYELQVDGADRLKSLAEDNYLREIQIPPGRGRILDRNGKELAATVEVESIFGNPRVLAHVPNAASKLATTLSLDMSRLIRTLKPETASGRPRYFAWLKRRVTPQEAQAVRDLELPGIGFRPEPRRFYPLRTLASTIIGYSGSDGQGLEGIELAYDKYLRGKTATLRGVRDALGRELLIDGMTDTSGVAGSDLTLSLDAYLSMVAKTAINRAVAEHDARAGIAVVVDPKTGELLAMANYPDFNPNRPAGASARGARNRAITDAFEPGSTMKTFTFAAALDAGQLRPEQLFDCDNGRMKVGRYTIRDTHPMKVVTAAEVYRQSSNIGTVKIARRIPREALGDVLQRFGFGQRTGIVLPGERRGIVRPVKRWGEIGHANVAFGQGLTATPLQITMGFAAVAAGGVYRPPRLGMRVQHGDGSEEILGQDNPEGVRVMSQEAAATLMEIMAGVPSREGTARLAAIPGYRLAGKTGTAQKVTNGRYDPDRWLASFVGIAPVDNPRLVIGIFIDEPKPIHLGGKVAAPAFREIAEAGLKYLNVPPTEAIVAENDEPSEVPLAQEADTFSEGPGFVAIALTDEQFFPIDPEVPESEQIELVGVPDFAGLSVGRAIALASESDLELTVLGSGVAIAQSLEPMHEVPAGTRLEITFEAGRPRPVARLNP